MYEICDRFVRSSDESDHDSTISGALPPPTTINISLIIEYPCDCHLRQTVVETGFEITALLLSVPKAITVDLLGDVTR